MKLKELEGKKAVRTGCSRQGDWSYTGRMLYVKRVTDGVAYITGGGFFKEIILPLDLYDDGKWEEYQGEESGK